MWSLQSCRPRLRASVSSSQPRHLVTVAGSGYALRVDGEGLGPEVAPEVPPVRTALIGREAELATLSSVLAGGARLLSLHGPGGVGKTRLAVELLRRAPAGRAGVFVPLEGCEDVAAAARLTASALGLELGSGPDPVGELQLGVAAEPRLIVLDNVEHLLPEIGPMIAGLLAGDEAGLRVVVTTRRRLGLTAEHVFRVEDLEVPVDGDALDRADAGRLMLRAASRARVGWSPGPADREALAEACRLVGGSPLAIELLASWLRLLDPHDLLDELRTSDEVLRASERDRPSRHESIAVALEASSRLLDATGATLLAELAVLHGPFERALASELTGATLASLGQLLDAALLDRVERGFDLHPLVRRFARGRLAARPDGGASVRQRHQAVLLGRLSAAFASRHEDARWPAPLAPLRGDLLEAWAHAARTADRAALAEHAPAFATWLDRVHEPGVAIRSLTAAAAGLGPDDPLASALALLAVGAGGPTPEPLADHVRAARGLGGALAVLALTHGAIGSHGAEPEAGLAWAEEAVALADGLTPSDPFLRLFPRAVAGSLLLRLGRPDAARGWLEAALAIDAPAGVARALVHLGQVELASGAPEAAREALSRAIGRLRADGDRSFLVMALDSLAAAEAAVGADPEPVLREALEEAVRSRLPAVWYGGVLVQLAAHQLAAHQLAAGRALEALRLHAVVDPSGLVLVEQRRLHAETGARLESALGAEAFARRAAEARAEAEDPRVLLAL